ncbi:hypothetical protein HPP92_019305 [Vanilla planifolia]|uniref:HMA domain-containing protein n=1 Tax=Vanilla planifolia TaxID=51239 RepID=A0A835Q6G0_VANPL|nr:hypothetical protein HPP92_019811 [Vanilla planifolia]KAG0465141.1 hypothetical protein HPP92_019305 [Vanilla planifolia]
MVSLIFKDIKGVNLSCTSTASAAVCTSLELRSMVRSSPSRAIDIQRRGPRRARTSNPICQTSSKSKSCSQKSRKNSEKETIDLISPVGSSRYLLNGFSSFEINPELENTNANRQLKTAVITKEEKELLMAASCARKDKVVVLRVSLHCKGCEGKVRKHISKMEGVTSFEIDLARKKVTIVGNITPLGVLSSVSKVKNAQLWP